MQYQTIITVEGDDYQEFEAVLYPDTSAEDRRLGMLHGRTDLDAALRHLAQWDYADGGEPVPDEPAGAHRYATADYVLTWDTGHSWASLDRIIDNDPGPDDGDHSNPDPPRDASTRV